MASLHRAVQKGDLDKVRNILRTDRGRLQIHKWKVTQRRYGYRYQPLHFCVLYPVPLEIPRLLIENGADVNAFVPGISNTPLLIAVVDDRQDCVKLLLESGADPDIPDDYRRTPLWKAAFWGRIEIAEMLINHGADVNARDYEDKTPLAAAEDEVILCELLAAHGGVQ